MADATFRSNWLDRALLAVAPRYGLARIRARAAAVTMSRHYEGASGGRRTQNWSRRFTDADSASAGALHLLRAHSRDLVRNNGWARNAVRIIPRNVVGYGITPKVPKALADAWRAWAGTTDCDAAGRLTFAGIQKLIVRGVVEGGEMLIRRRWRRPTDGLALPMQFQVLEPDYLDTSKTNFRGLQGGLVINGIEFDAIGRRVAYYLFDQHPGSSVNAAFASKRVDARDVLHVYDMERAGQDRGVPWLAAAIVKLKDFDEFEDAQLMRQKIAACFAAIETDMDGGGGGLGAASASDPLVETIEPGMVLKATPGKDVKFANPPTTTDDGFSVRTLRGIAAAMGVTYEDLTGDYSQVNFSSARMSRLAHWGNVYDWQWNMLIPQFCDPAWSWVIEAADVGGVASGLPSAIEWSPQPMPMTEPDREARANMLAVRALQKTPSQVIREQGGDPDTFLAEYAADLKKLDTLGIWSDADPRRVSQAGLTQARPAGTGFNDDAKEADAQGAGGGGAFGSDQSKETAE